MSIKEIIIKYYKEGKTVEKLAEEYEDILCMAEGFICDYPENCNKDGGYCKECWLNKIKEIIKDS